METAPEATLTVCCRCCLYAATLPSYLTKVTLSYPFSLHHGEKGTEFPPLHKPVTLINKKQNTDNLVG